MSSLKILIVGDPNSIHCNRFINMLHEMGIDVRIFCSNFLYLIEDNLKDIQLYVDAPIVMPNESVTLRVTDPVQMNCTHWPRFYKLISSISGFRKGVIPRSEALSSVLIKWQPDIIFSLKMQTEGYTVAEAKIQMGDRFRAKWIHFNWGTDIEFFGKEPGYKETHLPKIYSVLHNCDYFIADTQRDVDQALKMGLKGEVLGVSVANGGFDLDWIDGIRKKANQDRKVIVVKGRQGGYVGRAFHTLKALRNVPKSLLSGYKVRVIMPTADVKGAVDYIRYFDGMDIKILPRVDYEYLLGLFASARLTISSTIVDGFPLFLAESLTCGAFPLHSDMSAIREIVDHENNGLLFPVDDIEKTTACIIRGLEDDTLVRSAVEKNEELVKKRLDRHVIKTQFSGIFEKLGYTTQK